MDGNRTTTRLSDQQLVTEIRRAEAVATIFYFLALAAVVAAAVAGTWQLLIPAVCFLLWRSTALRIAFVDLTEAVDRGIRRDRGGFHVDPQPVTGMPSAMPRRAHGRIR
jgi:fatty acid desaturase